MAKAKKLIPARPDVVLTLSHGEATALAAVLARVASAPRNRAA